METMCIAKDPQRSFKFPFDPFIICHNKERFIHKNSITKEQFRKREDLRKVNY